MSEYPSKFRSNSRLLPARKSGEAAKLKRLAVGAAFPILFLIIWEILGRMEWISVLLFPPPSRIALSFYRLTESGKLYYHFRISALRWAGGFALGGSLGLITGLLVGLYRQTERMLNPMLQMLRMIPQLAITPIFVLWFGFGELSKVLLVGTGAFFPLYLNTFLGVRNADNRLFEVSKVLAFSRPQQLLRLVIPAAMPSILMGLRLSLGVAWLSLVVAELVGPTSGIGFLMIDARTFTNTPVVFVGIVIFALVGLGTDSLVRLMERRLLRWRGNEH
ncbi:ABC transporter permease [Paenibacillus sp. S150]|uniref:ABC transporter permease n=1 Tax=Paenibacillus sp. S150 TaxID=2749826 RepID=UPI001C55E7CA|nr:ABC transporter permease [Paenibacillus sp. S150]MBW4079827.1 ABC transporter permease [Paenibacillus sp. S150]